MPAIFTIELTVAPDQIDAQRHVNNIAYLRWLQDAAIAHSTEQGWSPQAYRDRGWAWVVRSHFIEYRRPAKLNDRVLIRTWVADMKKFTSLRKYEVVFAANDKQIVRAETNWAFVNTADERLIPIPNEVATSFEVVDSALRAKDIGEG